MHFRALCPSVMLATLHSGVVTSPFGSAAVAEEVPKETRKRRRWSWFDPREQDEDDKEAPSDEGENQKENRPPRNRSPAVSKGSRPIVVKRPALEAPNGLRRSPCMSFSPFGRGIRYACSPPPARSTKQRPARPTPPPMTGNSPPTPPPSPLATSPPDAAATHTMVTVVPRSAAQAQGAASTAHPVPRLFRSRGSLTALKSPHATVNPNQRFALVCLNDRFYWVSKEVDSGPRAGRRMAERVPHDG